jgi:hypothetical protein
MPMDVKQEWCEFEKYHWETSLNGNAISSNYENRVSSTSDATAITRPAIS